MSCGSLPAASGDARVAYLVVAEDERLELWQVARHRRERGGASVANLVAFKVEAPELHQLAGRDRSAQLGHVLVRPLQPLCDTLSASPNLSSNSFSCGSPLFQVRLWARERLLCKIFLKCWRRQRRSTLCSAPFDDAIQTVHALVKLGEVEHIVRALDEVAHRRLAKTPTSIVVIRRVWLRSRREQASGSLSVAWSA